MEQSRGLLKALRSGDWRDTAPTTAHMDEEEKEEVHYDQKDDGQGDEDENRLEGTPGYMAPEVRTLHSFLIALTSLVQHLLLDVYTGTGGRLHHPT